MLKLTAQICIDATPEKVWQVLADLEAIQIWSAPVIAAKCVSEQFQGVGSERVCQLKQGLVIREHWLEWQEGISYKYEGFGLPGIKRATNFWQVIPDGRKTLLISQAELELKNPFLRSLEPIFQWLIDLNRNSAKLLYPIKYYIENGRAFAGKAPTNTAIFSTC